MLDRRLRLICLVIAVQALAFTVETLYFYADNPEKASDTVAETLKAALAKQLNHYDFLAGRVRLNEEQMRMEIDRNYAGVQFTTATCEHTLEELGDLTQLNPLFRKFVPQAHNATTIADIPLMMIQVTKSLPLTFCRPVSSLLQELWFLHLNNNGPKSLHLIEST